MKKIDCLENVDEKEINLLFSFFILILFLELSSKFLEHTNFRLIIDFKFN